MRRWKEGGTTGDLGEKRAAVEDPAVRGAALGERQHARPARPPHLVKAASTAVEAYIELANVQRALIDIELQFAVGTAKLHIQGQRRLADGINSAALNLNELQEEEVEGGDVRRASHSRGERSPELGSSAGGADARRRGISSACWPWH